MAFIVLVDVEHEGHKYVGYSDNDVRRGDLNSAEQAIIPTKSLQHAP